VDLKDLTEAEWHRLKKAAGIKSSGFFKKHDAAVGKYVKEWQKARAKWKAERGAKSLLELNSALTKLQKSFNDFLSKKEFKTDLAKDLQQDLQLWRVEIDAKQIKLAKFYVDNEPQLKAKDLEITDGDIKKAGLEGLL
jgi:hypothetical protein